MAEEARLESVLTSKALRGFESHLLRKKMYYKFFKIFFILFIIIDIINDSVTE